MKRGITILVFAISLGMSWATQAQLPVSEGYTQLAVSGQEFSAAKLVAARTQDQNGLALLFEGSHDLHYYADADSAPLEGMELTGRVSAASPRALIIFNKKGLGNCPGQLVEPLAGDGGDQQHGPIVFTVGIVGQFVGQFGAGDSRRARQPAKTDERPRDNGESTPEPRPFNHVADDDAR